MATPLSLDASLSDLTGVGRVLAGRLERLGLARVSDLLGHLPLRYMVVAEARPPSSWPDGAHARLDLVVSGARTRNTRVVMTQATGTADNGETVRLVWFGQRWLARQIEGKRILCEGPMAVSAGRREMRVARHLLADAAGEEGDQAGLRPVYPATEGLSAARLSTLIGQALERAEIPDPLPAPIRGRLGLVGRHEALGLVHGPRTVADARAGRRRLAFDELLAGQLTLGLVRSRDAARPAPDLRAGAPQGAQVARALPFPLSPGQERLLGRLAPRLAGPRPLRVLVQGEVGAGKTVIAAVALATAAGAGRIGALLCPTELLARQHAQSLRAMLAPAGLEVVLLTGALGARERRAALGALSKLGGARVVVGTHALLGRGGLDPGILARLGLVVVDEQHRFGVAQRHALADRAAAEGTGIHLLQLSATPIPRSLALSAFGDMDVLTLPGRPGARRRVETAIATEAEASRAIDAAAAAGEGTFLIAPRIGEAGSEGGVLSDDLRERLVPGLSVAVVHGRQETAERAEAIAAFAAGEVQVLVATTVIEVGIDIPRASLIVITGAEAFGLAQLHQLRGRVGRAGQRARCLLVPGPDAPEGALERLEALAASDDGMALARADLAQRGAGEFFGDQQSGGAGLRIARLGRDDRTLAEARYAARLVLRADPALSHPAHRGLRTEIAGRIRELVRVARG